MSFRYITPEAIVKERFANNPPPAWKTAILCFRDYTRSMRIVQQSGAKSLGRHVLWGLDRTQNEEFVYEILFAGKSVGLITRCIWGGPQAAILVEELAYLGIENIISWSCMETSAFYATAAACNVKSLWMGHITDYIGETWENWFSDLESAENASIKLCLELTAILAVME